MLPKGHIRDATGRWIMESKEDKEYRERYIEAYHRMKWEERQNECIIKCICSASDEEVL